jgi:hypothetical protein
MPEGAMSGALLADIQRWECLAGLTVVMTSSRGVAAQGDATSAGGGDDLRKECVVSLGRNIGIKAHGSAWSPAWGDTV